MPNLGDMVVKIVGDATGFTKSLDETQKKMLSFGVNVAAVLGVVKEAAKVIGDQIQKYADYGSAIYDASQKTGLSTQAIQEWKFIAEQTGGTLENVTGAVAVMTRTLESNKDVYKSLGIELKKSDGTFRSTTEIFNETVNVLSNMKDQTERDQLAFKLLGRGAQSLIPILNAGAGELDNMRSQAEQLGIILKDEAIKRSDELGDSIDRLDATAKSFGSNLVDYFQPAILAITTLLEKQTQLANAFLNADEILARARSGTATLDQLKQAISIIDASIKSKELDKAFIWRTEAATKEIAALEKWKAEILKSIKAAEEAAKPGAVSMSLAEAQVDAEKRKAEADAAQARYKDAISKLETIINGTLTERQKLLIDIQKIEAMSFSSAVDIAKKQEALTILKQKYKEYLDEERLMRSEASQDELSDQTISDDQYIELKKDTLQTVSNLELENELISKEELEKIRKEESDKEIEEAERVAEEKKRIDEETNQAIEANARQFISALQALNRALLDQRLNQLEEELQAELERNGVAQQSRIETLQEQYQAAVESGDQETAERLRQEILREQITQDFERKKAKLQYESALNQWNVDLAMAFAEGALAIIKTMSSLPFPLNLIPAGLQAAATAVQIAAMQAAKPLPPSFAEGGIVQPVPGGIQATVAEAGMAEAIIPLDRLDRMLSTGTSGSGDNGNINLVVNLDGKPFLDKIFPATKNRTVLISQGAVV